MTDTYLADYLAGWNLARLYYFTMTQLDIAAVGVSRVHNADILLDFASCRFSSLFMSQTPVNTS